MNGMIRIARLLLVSAGLLGLPAVASAQAKPAAPPAAPATAAPTRFVPPIRGQADLGCTKPLSKRVKDEVVTVIKVKNLSLGSIVGLKVSEFWYDKAGNPVTGSDDRLKKPLLPNEVATMTLRTPYNAKMDRNTYQFSHANGTIKTKVLTTIS